MYFVLNIQTRRRYRLKGQELVSAHKATSKDEYSALFPEYFDILPNDRKSRVLVIFYNSYYIFLILLLYSLPRLLLSRHIVV